MWIIRGSIFRQLSVNSTKADKLSILRIKLYSENLFMPRAQHAEPLNPLLETFQI